MKIAILGLGYVGLTAAGCLLKEGHEVRGVDPNQKKLETIASGKIPIYEPGLEELIAEGVASGKLNVQSIIDESVAACDIAIVCVGTPSAPDGAHNMSYIAEVTKQLADSLSKVDRKSPISIMYRSTIAPGTMEQLIAPFFRVAIGSNYFEKVELIYNPEFLRESMAIHDYFNPPKIVIGTRDGSRSAVMDALYKNVVAPTFYTGFREAEFTKFVDNTWHATKVAFANEIGRVCLELDINPKKVHEIFISDTKLNISPYYTRPGGAFGGSCLPKDVRALAYISEQVDAGNYLVESLIRSNEAHKRFLFSYVTRKIAPGAKILMVGLAFKDESDDLRESPQIDLVKRLLKAGYDVSVYDPAVNPTSLIGQNLGYSLSKVPNLADIMVTREQAESDVFQLMIDANGRSSRLRVNAASFIDINTL